MMRSLLDSLGQLPRKLPSPPWSDVVNISILPVCFCYPVTLEVTEQSIQAHRVPYPGPAF